MAVYWVQYWGYLPAVVEEPPRRDETEPIQQHLPGTQPFILDMTSTHHPTGHHPVPSDPKLLPSTTLAPLGTPSSIPARPDELPTAPSDMADPPLAPHAPLTVSSDVPVPEQELAYRMPPSAVPSPSLYYDRASVNAYHMAAMSSSLPGYPSQQPLAHYSPQRPAANMAATGMMYPLQHPAPLGGQPALSYHPAPDWMAVPYAAHPPSYAPAQALHPSNPASHHYAHPASVHATPDLLAGPQVYSNPAWNYSHQQPTLHTYYPLAAAGHGFPARHGNRYAVPAPPRRASLPLTEGLSRGASVRAGTAAASPGSSGRGPPPGGFRSSSLHTEITPGSGQVGPIASSTPAPVPRGPPRKPKQSGHALWVGNLPAATNVMELKDYFSQDATSDIESVFLIAKSNCAFVNYKIEAACTAAMARFHDSRFKGVRLVCRLRRTLANAPASGVPTGPAASLVRSRSAERASTRAGPPAQASASPGSVEAARRGAGRKVVDDRFFVVKSLTVEDLETSVRNGVWATQAHNEVALNEAHASATHVYLIFSANKSGEYFGYARMVSAIGDEAAPAPVSASSSWTPHLHPPPPPPPLTDDDDRHPRAIATPATASAPKGRVIDDSARGTIFWEADTDEGDSEPEPEPEPEPAGVDVTEPGADRTATATTAVTTTTMTTTTTTTTTKAAASGRPFPIEWLCTRRLPFYRTRGLRNAWNANREVKIARDGTELEPSVGARLLQMFHQPLPPMPGVGRPPMVGMALPRPAAGGGGGGGGGGAEAEAEAGGGGAGGGMALQPSVPFWGQVPIP
ncbi:MAG: hypothetical protein M1826_003733 [Phylliscum demangeonii]|nr:MAG: hypothetical protein M1826_003733 [Phylliscum demangeonii]